MTNNIQNNLAKHYFFNSYKNFVDYMLVTNTDYNMYQILVTQNDVDNDNKTVTITITNSRYIDREYKIPEDKSKNKYFAFSNNITLPSNEVPELIDAIIKDFEFNHYIAYSMVNESKMLQTLQNTTFSLCIKLYNNEDLEKALQTNGRINRDSTRLKKVLTK